MMTTAGSAAAITTVGLVLLAGYWGVLRPRLWRFPKPPADLSLEEVSFSGADGTRLWGWFLPNPTSERALILCHGWLRNRMEPFALGVALNRRGYQVLLFDFRACGRSQGLFPTMGYREVDDLLAAVDYLRRRPETSRAEIGALGISLGAAVALMAAARCRDLAAVVADSAFASLDQTITLRGQALRRGLMRAVEKLARLPLTAIRPVEAVRSMAGRPVFFIHGATDRLVPPENSHVLYAAASEPKHLWLVDGVGHAKARLLRPQEYLERVDAFFGRYL